MSIRTFRAIREMWARIERGEPIDVRFIEPAIATFLGCAKIARPGMHVNIDPGCQEYAERSGLGAALTLGPNAIGRPRAGKEGVTWSRLTTLFQASEIESCNQTINDLLFAQLSELMPRCVLDELARVVGELHDNVASHADGRGFSAAQYYPGDEEHSQRLELSVGDQGRGFLRNVRRVRSDIHSHEEAIRWCLQKGHTASRSRGADVTSGDWIDPYLEEGSGQPDHHMGWGLWLLQELVRSTGSELWIWSGDSVLALDSSGHESTEPTPIRWPGVLINLTFFPARARGIGDRSLSPRLQELARDLGL